MATAFVTGGSGFVGGRLIERLRREGLDVRALARSESAASKAAIRGAEPVRGDIHDAEAVRAGAAGCEFAFHAAARVGEAGRWSDFERDNVDGTRTVLRACADAGVRRFVHVGTEAALLAGRPLIEVDERAPLRPDSPAPYPATKARAEQAVREASRDGFETVVVRPRFVWGRGDTTVLPAIVAAVRSGRFRWIGDGRHRTSTTHVDNTVEGLWLGAQRGRPGGVYFVTDGEPVVMREFVERLLATQGVEPPQQSVPRPVARTIAAVADTLWHRLPLPGEPPLSRMAVWVMSLETTIDITRARKELGYEPVRTIEDGLAELSRNRESA